MLHFLRMGNGHSSVRTFHELILACESSHNLRVGPKHCCRQVLYRRALSRYFEFAIGMNHRQCDTTEDRQPHLVSKCLPEEGNETDSTAIYKEERQIPTDRIKQEG